MLILASESPARQVLLRGAGLRFDVSPAAIDERAMEARLLGKTAAPPEIAQRLAGAKAATISAARSGDLVIGADQVLEYDGKRLHKPETLDAAARQLDLLRGRTHHLHAGVALARDGRVLWTGLDSARLTMREFSRAERDAVLLLEGPEVLSAAGGYRLEGASIRLFEAIEGDYFTILGLPLLPLLAALRHHAPELLDPLH